MSNIAVLGAGAWGTALGLSLAQRGGHSITLWAHDAQHAEDIHALRENQRFLPGFALPAEIQVTASLEEAASLNDILLLVTPTEFVGETLAHIKPSLRANHVIVSASKGLEEETHRRMSEVIRAQVNNPVAVLSGPNFAREVAVGMPTASVIASEDEDISRQLQTDFSSATFRAYRSTDVIGVELGGALKNVIALAAGITVGLNLGANTAAALMTRGLAEITRLAVACGAKPETLNGLAGMGDLMLTCTGPLSRNRSVGIELGHGRPLSEILAAMNGKVAEGVRCTAAAVGLARQYGVEIPIAEQMNAILNEGRSPQEAIRQLMTRPGGLE